MAVRRILDARDPGLSAAFSKTSKKYRPGGQAVVAGVSIAA